MTAKGVCSFLYTFSSIRALMVLDAASRALSKILQKIAVRSASGSWLRTSLRISVWKDIFFHSIGTDNGKGLHLACGGRKCGHFQPNPMTAGASGYRPQFFHALLQNLKFQWTAGDFSCHGLKYVGFHAETRASHSRQQCRILFAVKAAYPYTEHFSFGYTD